MRSALFNLSTERYVLLSLSHLKNSQKILCRFLRCMYGFILRKLSFRVVLVLFFRIIILSVGAKKKEVRMIKLTPCRQI